MTDVQESRLQIDDNSVPQKPTDPPKLETIKEPSGRSPKQPSSKKSISSHYTRSWWEYMCLCG